MGGDNRCFWVVHEDGSQEDFSMKKCLDALELDPPYEAEKPKASPKAAAEKEGEPKAKAADNESKAAEEEGEPKAKVARTEEEPKQNADKPQEKEEEKPKQAEPAQEAEKKD